MNRPDCFERAMEFLGDPEESAIREYVQLLEKQVANLSSTAEELARQFHDTYERLAPEYGYETRADTKKFDPASPNGRLMIEVCKPFATEIERLRAEVEAHSKARLIEERLKFAALAELDEVRAKHEHLRKTLIWLDRWLGHQPMTECSERISAAIRREEE